MTDLAQSRSRPRGTPLRPTAPEGPVRVALDKGRSRLLMLGAMFGLAFLVVGARLVDVTLLSVPEEPKAAQSTPRAAETERADIIDRNGVLLASSLPTPSLYANPSQVIDAADAARRLAQVLPGIKEADLRAKLAEERTFVWVQRQLTPRQQSDVIRLGLPGLYFHRDERRVYPQGRLASHVIGFSGVDHVGLQGVERALDARVRESREPLQLALDLRLQHVMRDELVKAIAEFKAIGAAGLIMDVHSAEIVAMVSLPDFDPNSPGTANPETLFNRVTLGAYEMGSTFKIFTTAMALDSGRTNMNGGYDATRPIKVSRYTIDDYKPKRRWLTVPEIFKYSSNIGSVKMALDVGIAGQRAFLDRLGLLAAPSLELPEVGHPLVPNPWREINAMTIAFGHGLSVTPLQMTVGVAAVVNGGIMRKPTLLKVPYGSHPDGVRAMKARTSDDMRRLLHLVVTDGTGKKAAAAGYMVGGKTGTAEKVAGKGYRKKALLSSFVGAFPINDPQFVLLVMIDEPQGTAGTQGYATGGWVAAPPVARIVERIAPLVGVLPIDEKSPQIRRDLLLQASAPAPARRANAPR